jgi:hypothetical protein
VGRQKVKKVVIPMNMKDRLFRHKVRRTINHLTILTCVAASGDALCPMIVTSRKVPDDIYHGWHRPGKDLLIECNAKPYVDRPLLENFTGHQLIPHITALRTNPCYSKMKAVLLMDNCSAHVTPEIFGLLGENHVRIGTYAPHIINIFQALDRSFFDVFKTKDKFGWIRMMIRPLLRRYTNQSASSIRSRRPKTVLGALSRPGFRMAQELSYMSSNSREG